MIIKRICSKLIFISLVLLFVFFSCTDPLPSKINPYDFLRTDWTFTPSIPENDTLEINSGGQTGGGGGPITIIPYIVNEYDEWIVDTTYVELYVKLTLLNFPDVSQEFYFLDTTASQDRVLPGDSIWTSFTFNHRFNGQPIEKYLAPVRWNFNPYRMEWQVAHIRLEGRIQLYKNILPMPLPTKVIKILYWIPPL